MRPAHRMAWLAIGAMALAACSEDSVSGPNDGQLDLDGRVPLSFAVAPAAGNDGDGLSVAQDSGGEVVDPASIQFELVQIVLDKIRLARADEEEDGEAGVACAHGGDHCGRFGLFRRHRGFTTGPVLIDLPLDGSEVTPFADSIPEGVYDGLFLEVHRPVGHDSATRAFREANPGWPASASIRVKGTYDAGDGNGPQPFDIFLRVTALLRQPLDPPLVIEPDTDPSTVGITVTVDVNRWFRGPGGKVIDPRALSSDPRMLQWVEHNIWKSFGAFCKRRGRPGWR